MALSNWDYTCPEIRSITFLWLTTGMWLEYLPWLLALWWEREGRREEGKENKRVRSEMYPEEQGEC